MILQTYQGPTSDGNVILFLMLLVAEAYFWEWPISQNWVVHGGNCSVRLIIVILDGINVIKF